MQLSKDTSRKTFPDRVISQVDGSLLYRSTTFDTLCSVWPPPTSIYNSLVAAKSSLVPWKALISLAHNTHSPDRVNIFYSLLYADRRGCTGQVNEDYRLSVNESAFPYLFPTPPGFCKHGPAVQQSNVELHYVHWV